MTTASAVRNPFHLDRLVRWSGRATRRAAPGPHKQLQGVLGLAGHTRVVRYKQGDPHSPAAKSLFYIDQLARGEHTTPYPQIVEELAVAKRADFEGVKTGVLEARLHELIQGEHDRERAQNEALMTAAVTGDYGNVADEVLPHADSLVEIAVLAEEISERRE